MGHRTNNTETERQSRISEQPGAGCLGGNSGLHLRTIVYIDVEMAPSDSKIFDLVS